MARYIKANPKVAKFLDLERDRNTVSDGNYLLWQTAYTEFVFTDAFWPDFRKEAYLKALEEFASRDRRFGKIK